MRRKRGGFTKSRSRLSSSCSIAAAGDRFFSLLRGPANSQRSGASRCQLRAADGLFWRQIGTARVAGLGKGPETAALGNRNWQKEGKMVSLFRPSRLSRSNTKEKQTSERAREELQRGASARALRSRRLSHSSPTPLIRSPTTVDGVQRSK